MSTSTHRPPPQRQRRTAANTGTRRAYRVAQYAGGLAVIAFVVAIGLVLRGGDGDPAPRTSGEVVAPANLTESGWIPVGDGPVKVAVYFDYLCPACGAFEAANGDELQRLLDSGDVTVELRPIAFLDDLSEGTEYSTRSANALATVADAAPDRVWAFHRALYRYQPEEGSAGLSDEDLAAIAHEVEVPVEVAARFADGDFEAWTAERTERAFADGVEGTPTILVDGVTFEGDPYTVGPLTAAVEQAAP